MTEAPGQSSRSSERGLLDLLPDGVLVTDEHGVVRDANAEAERLLELPPGALVGRTLDELPLADGGGRGWREANQPWRGLRTSTGVPEQSWVTAGGAEVLVTARILRDVPLGPVTGVALALRSGRGRTRLDRERSDLVATVAHELRSPLTGVKGFVQVMLNRWDQLRDEQKKLMLTTVLTDADRLSRLITELLDVARIDTGRLSIAPRSQDPRPLVHRVVESVRAGTSRPVEYRPGDSLPEIHVDPDKFTQVVTNLIENAVRHGAGTVRVSTDPLADGDEPVGVRLVVEDSGQGIPPEMRQRILTKFWTGGTGGGSGLGLYLVNGLVRAHGGVLTVGEAEDGGARLTVDWPVESDGEGPAPNLHTS